MKASSKYLKFSLLFTGSVALAAVTLAADLPGTLHNRGTDILHYFVRKDMSNAGLESAATARINARQNQQGHANNQNLDIIVKGLETHKTYALLALLDGDTNLTKIADFSTDAKGRAYLYYRQLGNGKSLGRGKLPLPETLDPVSLVRWLGIFNSSTQEVLTADMTFPDRLQYLIKRDLSFNTVSASLRIQANVNRTQFRLLAAGLNPSNDYLLVLNGGVMETYTADAKGRLVIKAPLEIPTEILNLRSVALWDSASNIVVSTTLP